MTRINSYLSVTSLYPLSWRQFLARPYEEGIRNLKKAVVLSGQCKFLAGAAHCAAGLMLLVPIINMAVFLLFRCLLTRSLEQDTVLISRPKAVSSHPPKRKLKKCIIVSALQAKSGPYPINGLFPKKLQSENALVGQLEVLLLPFFSQEELKELGTTSMSLRPFVNRGWEFYCRQSEILRRMMYPPVPGGLEPDIIQLERTKGKTFRKIRFHYHVNLINPFKNFDRERFAREVIAIGNFLREENNETKPLSVSRGLVNICLASQYRHLVLTPSEDFLQRFLSLELTILVGKAYKTQYFEQEDE